MLHNIIKKPAEENFSCRFYREMAPVEYYFTLNLYTQTE